MEEAFFREGFGEDVGHACDILVGAVGEGEGRRTVLVIQMDVIASDVGGHCYGWDVYVLTD